MEKKRRHLSGRVVSTKMSKTVTVAVESIGAHPKYRKIIRKISNVKAHDEKGACRVGDVVKIEECRPLSKTKHHRVIEVVSRGQLPEVQPDDSNL
ncbi:MAG: 30S ribosomal protein S17 [Dehalococcoidia bacterium]|nr:30S ribosomal protein S17 [Dehalococcoidia bacterium]